MHLLTTINKLLLSLQSSYAQLLAATTLTKLVTRNPNALSMQQRLDIRNYILNYLASRPKLAPFVTQALVQLFARITKLGWFETDKDEFVFRNVIPHVRPFVQVTSNAKLLSHYFLANNSFSPFLYQYIFYIFKLNLIYNKINCSKCTLKTTKLYFAKLFHHKN